MKKISLLLMVCLATSGCGGYYTMTVGDHVGPTGTEVPVVVRLQRNDFFFLNFPVKNAVMCFRVADGELRAAYTDKSGYAGTTVPTYSKPGRYTLHVDHMDAQGEEISADVPIFLWDPKREVIAVDADALPLLNHEGADAAAASLRGLNKNADIIYLTRKPVQKHSEMHRQLETGHYPDGVILLWKHKRWRVERGGRFNLPRVVIESRLISQLPELRKMFPKLSVGICTSTIAAKTFAAAGMRSVIVGSPPAEVPNCTSRNSWTELGKKGI